NADRQARDGGTFKAGARPGVHSVQSSSDRSTLRSSTGPAARGGSLSLRTTVGAYVALTKPRIVELLLITTIPPCSWLPAGGPALVSSLPPWLAGRRQLARPTPSTWSSTATSTGS